MMDTAIIILHYNNEERTNKCIESVFDTAPLGTEIIVVDNFSDKPYKRDDVEVLRNDNRHCVSGMNMGFYYALYERNAKYIVNMDNDVTCLNGWLQPLIKEMETHPKTGICGGKQWDDKMEHFRSVGMDLTGCLFVDYPITRTETVWLQGSFYMMRGEMMRRIGLHDTRYMDICSDSDYCFHALDRDWQVVFVPESSVMHIGNASFKEDPINPTLTNNGKDIKQMLGKWCGIKFNVLLKQMPVNARDGSFGKVTYTEETRCPVSV